MNRTISILFAVSMLLLTAGGFTYRFGSKVNNVIPQDDVISTLAGSPGDKWLYVGGLMMLLAGAVCAAAIKSLLQERRGSAICSLRTSDLD